MQPAINVRSTQYRHLLIVRGLGPDGWRDDLTIDDLGARGGFFGGDALVWSGNGTRLAVCLGGDIPRRADAEVLRALFVFDLATKTRTPLALPGNVILTDWSCDGRRALTTPSGLWELTPDGRRPLRPAADRYWQEFQSGVFSPDGKRMLATGMHGTYEVRPEEKAERERLGLSPTRPPIELFVMEIDTGKAAPVKDMPPNAAVESFCWSPDGRRIAYVWRAWTPRWPGEVDGELHHLTVCDVDGSNARTVLSTADQLGNVNWR